MDSVWLAGTIVSAYVTTVGAVVAAFVLRSNSRKPNTDPWDGRERRGDGWHSSPCPYVTSLTTGIEQVRADIEALRENLGGRIDDLYKRSVERRTQ